MQTVLPFTAHCYSSRYLSITDNELEVSPIGLLPHGRKRWISDRALYQSGQLICQHLAILSLFTGNCVCLAEFMCCFVYLLLCIL